MFVQNRFLSIRQTATALNKLRQKLPDPLGAWDELAQACMYTPPKTDILWCGGDFLSEWNSGCHSKYLLQYHLIFVCKYRKSLLKDSQMIADCKRFSSEICSKHKVTIKYMETDCDHIHYMIETTANINLAKFIGTMKAYITYYMWRLHSFSLGKHFWKERTFFTDGYFLCSVGNVSEYTLQKYIENQG